MPFKVTIIVAETMEDLQSFDINGRSPVLNCLSFFKSWFDSSSWDNMCKLFQFSEI